MLSPWPEQRRGHPYGRGVPKPPPVWRLVLLLIVILVGIYRLLLMSGAGQ
jgi:hypothetical protein